MNGKDQAFPTQGGCPGLTVRDHIAIEAMKPLIARYGMHSDWLAVEAFKHADAMIRASGGKP